MSEPTNEAMNGPMKELTVQCTSESDSLSEEKNEEINAWVNQPTQEQMNE